MKQPIVSWGWWLQRLAYLLAAALVCICLLSAILTQAAAPFSDDQPAWANPASMTLRRVSEAIGAQSESNYFNNLDCYLMTYRRVAQLPFQNEMDTGCFINTAFGLFDVETNMVIFSGSDEGVPLRAFTSSNLLVPWPGASLVSLSSAPTGGMYVSLYLSGLPRMQDFRNALLQLTAKQLLTPPDLHLRDRAGQLLVINPQTLAFSDGGGWLVAETLSGSFVRINLATLDMVAFAPAFGSQGSPALLKSRVAVSHDGHYVAISNDVAASFKVYDLTTCTGPMINLQPEQCRFYDYRPFVADQVGSLRSIRHVRFLNSGLLSFEALTDSEDSGGIYVLSPTDGIDSLIDYLGLGDSYASGEGAFNYRAGTDSSDSTCHLSVRSYPLLLTRDLFSARGGQSVACSGARINDVGSTSNSYRGQIKSGLSFLQLQQSQPALLQSVMTNFLPGYVAQQRFAGQYQPVVTTVMAGGNDIGFGDILKQCVTPHLSNNTCFNSYEDRQELLQLIDRTAPRLTNLYKQLRARAPATRLYAIGYPQLAGSGGSCALNVQLNQSELVFAEELIDYLNGAIHRAADKAGVVYVDISQALNGHRLCQTASHNVAVNGITAGNDGGPFGLKIIGRESFHPNALGHELIEQAILQKTANLTKVVPDAASPPDSQKLLLAPKTGRVITNRVPIADMVTPIVLVGQSTAVKVSGNAAGLRPTTSYTVRLDGPTGPVIATTQSNADGDIDTTLTLPAGTPPGGHTIDVTGPNQTDEPVDVTQPIYIPAGETDADADGIPDATDSCPVLYNSGQDNDQDGVDDVCDGFIDLPPSSAIQTPVSGTPIVTATFTTNDPIPPTTPATRSTRTTPAVGRVLGVATVNPTGMPRQIVETAPSNGASNQPATIDVPPNHRWFPWLILLIIAMCLLGIGYCLGRLVDEQNEAAYA